MNEKAYVCVYFTLQACESSWRVLRVSIFSDAFSFNQFKQTEELMCMCAISSKLETLQARIYFRISVCALKWKVDSHACSVSNFKNKTYTHIGFFVRLN